MLHTLIWVHVGQQARPLKATSKQRLSTPDAARLGLLQFVASSEGRKGSGRQAGGQVKNTGFRTLVPPAPQRAS